MNWGTGKNSGLLDLGKRPKILLSRTDRIGDVVLSLPVARMVKSALPDAEIYFLVREETAPVVALAPGVDGTLTYYTDDTGKAKLQQQLAETRFDAVICLYPRPELAHLFSKAKIPVRIGTARRWYSYRFTHRVNISRKGSGRHEKDLNLDLVKPLGLTPDYGLVPEMTPPPVTNSVVEMTPAFTAGKPLCVIHPGDGGSAVNWPVERYAELAERLSAEDIEVVITGLELERERHLAAFGGSLSEKNILSGRTSLGELFSLLSRASVFVGGSTGPLHLAAALGTSVVGLYGPIHTTTPDRWGPCGKGHIVLTPGVPVCHCAVGQCKLGNCMEYIAVDAVAAVCLMIFNLDNPELSACPPNKKRPASDLTPKGGICR